MKQVLPQRGPCLVLESTANGSARRRLGAQRRRRLLAGQRPPAHGSQPGDASRPSNARHGDAPIGAAPIDGTCAWRCPRPRLMAHAAAPSICREARSSGPWRGCRASTPQRAAPSGVAARGHGPSREGDGTARQRCPQARATWPGPPARYPLRRRQSGSVYTGDAALLAHGTAVHSATVSRRWRLSGTAREKKREPYLFGSFHFRPCGFL